MDDRDDEREGTKEDIGFLSGVHDHIRRTIYNQAG